MLVQTTVQGHSGLWRISDCWGRHDCTGERIILLDTQVSSNVSMYSIRKLMNSKDMKIRSVLILEFRHIHGSLQEFMR